MAIVDELFFLLRRAELADKRTGDRGKCQVARWSRRKTSAESIHPNANSDLCGKYRHFIAITLSHDNDTNQR